MSERLCTRCTHSEERAGWIKCNWFDCDARLAREKPMSCGAEGRSYKPRDNTEAHPHIRLILSLDAHTGNVCIASTQTKTELSLPQVDIALLRRELHKYLPPVYREGQ